MPRFVKPMWDARAQIDIHEPENEPSVWFGNLEDDSIGYSSWCSLMGGDFTSTGSIVDEATKGGKGIELTYTPVDERINLKGMFTAVLDGLASPTQSLSI